MSTYSGPVFDAHVHTEFAAAGSLQDFQALKSRFNIHLGFMHVHADDARLQLLYSLAREFDVPVLFHTGDTGWHRSKLKYAHPLSMDEIIVDHPQVNFLLVHSGNPWFVDA